MELNEHNQNNTNPTSYNDIPVHYCAECLSLKVRVFNEDMDYCDECGSTDIRETHIDDWERQYQEKYKENYLKAKKKK